MLPNKTFFLVQEMGLEPTQLSYTPLKRARLPIPPLRHRGHSNRSPGPHATGYCVCGGVVGAPEPPPGWASAGPAGAAGAGVAGAEIGAVGTDFITEPPSTLPLTKAISRVVSTKPTKPATVSRWSSVVALRAPKAAIVEPPPNTERSAPLPCWSRTTRIRKMQSRTCSVYSR